MAWPLGKLVRRRSKWSRFVSLLMVTFDDFSCRLMKRMTMTSACSRNLSAFHKRRQTRLQLGAEGVNIVVAAPIILIPITLMIPITLIPITLIYIPTLILTNSDPNPNPDPDPNPKADPY
jgi:hypothetical protein